MYPCFERSLAFSRIYTDYICRRHPSFFGEMFLAIRINTLSSRGTSGNDTHNCMILFLTHRKKQDRIEGNRRALKVLDRLAHASPVKKYGKRKGHGHNKYSTSGMGSRSTSFDALNSVPMAKADQHHEVIELMEKPEPPAHGTGGKRKRRKRISVLDQVGDAISAVALKDSSFNRAGQYASLHSARTLARKLFASLSDNHPPRNLVMSGTSSNFLLL